MPIYSSSVIGNYNPLSIWTFAVESKIYGLDNPGKWHLTNVLLHLLCVFFVFKIALRLHLNWFGAFCVAILFGIHPMRVESVAWVTERKDVLYGVFYLAALYLYIKQKTSDKKYTLWIVILFLLSLFSKIQAVILPLSMVAVDYYFSNKVTVKDFINKWFYFGLSLAFGLLGVFILSDQGSIESADTYPLWQRIFVGSYSYLIYLVKLVIPFQLSPLYPYPAKVPWYFYPSIVIIPAAIYALYYFYKHKMKVWFFGLAFFSVNIVFLLQILGAGQGILADRFTYIAYFGLFFIVGYYASNAYFINKPSRPVLYGITGALVVGMAFITINQNKIWKNSETLWTHVLKYHKNTTLPYGNRGNYLRDIGRKKDALADYTASLNLDGNNAKAFNSRARLYFDMAQDQNDLRLALQDYNKAIELDPTNGEYLINRGATYARLGNLPKSLEDLNLGLQYKPDHVTGYLNRSIIYNSQGRIQDALNDINTYLKYKPYNSDLWYEKARALRGLNRASEAIDAYSTAIKINGNKGLYYYERSRTHYGLGDVSKAQRDLQSAIALKFKEIDPAYRQQLGI